MPVMNSNRLFRQLLGTILTIVMLVALALPSAGYIHAGHLHDPEAEGVAAIEQTSHDAGVTGAREAPSPLGGGNPYEASCSGLCTCQVSVAASSDTSLRRMWHSKRQMASAPDPARPGLTPEAPSKPPRILA
ncbi:hypothetical protein [Methylobacterium oxalidis]|uniref:hypothetical protein n=1 Tax=Methylobacterium oxalidis TaxID=944322 RepID=UPI003315A3F4